MNKYISADECAEVLGIQKQTFLRLHATRADFPERITITKKRFFWIRQEFDKWICKQQEKTGRVKSIEQTRQATNVRGVIGVL